MNAAKLALARDIAKQKFLAGERPANLMSEVNQKILKSLKRGVMTLGLSLAPAKSSGYNLCSYATPECVRFCLFGTGHASEHMIPTDAQVNPIWVARILRTILFKKDNLWFMDRLVQEIHRGTVKATKKGLDLCVRLNVFSDWVWEKQKVTVTEYTAKRTGIKAGTYKNLMEIFPQVMFYDYTAVPHRMSEDLPQNYHLTFSLKENNHEVAQEMLDKGYNISAVVQNDLHPSTFMGYPTVDGDEHDLRYMDPKNSVVVLKPKGALAKSNSTFVQRIIPISRIAA